MVNVQDHMGMVHTIVNKRFKQFGHKYDYAELFQNGCVGLMIAAKKFDESKNIKFSTFAYIHINGYILRCIRDDKWYMGKRKDRGIAKAPASLDAPITNLNNEDDSTRYLDHFSSNESLFDKVELNILLDKLPSKLNKVIKLRYLNDLTQQEVAKVMGSTQCSISRCERRALKFLREEMMA
jgi:RNA polymerase sporulation-specific sigma factor